MVQQAIEQGNGGGVLGHVSGVLMIEEPEIVAWLGKSEHPAWHPLALALGVGFTAFGWWGSRHHKQRRTARPVAPVTPAGRDASGPVP